MMFVTLVGARISERNTMIDLYVDPVLGPLPPNAEGYWSKSVAHGDVSIDVDVNLDGDVDGVAVGRLTSRLRDLSGLEVQARAAMRAEAESEASAVALYRSHHAAELSSEELAACFGGSDAWRADVSAFVSALQLKRVGLYPDAWKQSIIMDFTLGAAVTNYLLVVSFDCDAQVVAVVMES